MEKPIYLDYNATTPIDSEVFEAMKPFLENHFGNPSSVHFFGIEAKKSVEAARKQIANALNCKTTEILFTSGGTESNNLALKGIAFAYQNRGKHIITSEVEHPAVFEVCKFLEKQGFRISYIPVFENGIINLEVLEKSITSETILVSIMHANNETGVIQPIEKIAEMLKGRNIFFHTDAAQSVGKVDVDIQKLNVDLLSVAGHKLYAPKGVGALFVREGVRLEKILHGADHEQNLRAGTENVPYIAALGKAFEIAKRDLTQHFAKMKFLRDKLQENLKNLSFLDTKINGDIEKRLPNTLNISFSNLEASLILSEMENIAASAGAACHSDKISISKVLTAMNVPEHFARGTIRFSVGKYSTETEINNAVKIISETLEKLTNKKSFHFSKKFSDVKLTHFTHGLGCGCKIRPQYLEKVLQNFPIPTDKNILVNIETSDDASVYQIDDLTAIVQTVDFFTPVVDSPYDFGAIAAANSLSDIYAMGAKPLFALNIVAFPENRLPMEVLQEILKGANDKAAEAGISILGGHTVEDSEPKFGMTVTGIIHPQKILKNSTAKVGDSLILTKPIGTGILSTAMKRGLVEKETENLAIKTMSELNAVASEVMRDFPISACTDVTGFGLLGHLREMSQGSKVDVNLFSEKVPILPEVKELAAANIIPGGTLNNLDFVSQSVDFQENITEIMKKILCDAQTSGGLLISISQSFKNEFLKKLIEKNIIFASEIGIFTQKGNGKITVF